MRNKWKSFGLCTALIGTLSIGLAGVAANAEINDTPDAVTTELGTTEVSGEEMSIKDIVADAMPAMVSITNTSVQTVRDYYGGRGSDLFDQFFGDFFGGYGFGYGYGNGYGNGYYGNGNDGQREQESVSAGSGIIVGETDENILIATNAHVISGATELSVAFIDESVANAEVVGEDTDNDVALVKVAKSDLEEETLKQINVIPIGSSEEAALGEQIVVIGNALGYGQSVSSGIISAFNRTIRTMNEDTYEIETMEGLIQTDAAINPGNSGGAMLNMKGELIGINCAKATSQYSEGVGYAIPIDVAEPILSDIANGRQPVSKDAESDSSIEAGNGNAFLGVTVLTISEEYAEAYGIPTGAYVNSIEPGSAAEKAGIRQGDIITAVDGTEVTSSGDLKNLISHYSEGDTVELTVVCFSVGPNGGFGPNGNSSNYSTTTVTVTFGTQAVDEAA